jgi:hypothetical protein
MLPSVRTPHAMTASEIMAIGLGVLLVVTIACVFGI